MKYISFQISDYLRRFPRKYKHLFHISELYQLEMLFTKTESNLCTVVPLHTSARTYEHSNIRALTV